MTNKFRFMLLSMATLGIFSCSDKLTDDGVQTPSENGIADGFVSFKISNIGSGMRAAGANGNGGDYLTGTEYNITTEPGANVVFFFTNNGSYYGKSYLQLMTDTENSEQTNNDGHTHLDSEKIYSARVKKSNGSNGFTPASCILILNANPTQLETLGEISLSELEKTCDKDLGQYGEYFTMTNTVYVNEKEGNSNYHMVENAVEVNPATHICSTWEDAQKTPIEVHVERVASKFEVTFNKDGKSILNNGMIIFDASDAQQPLRKFNNNSKEVVEGNTTKWAVKINNWAVNAKETQTYFLKNLSYEDNITNGKLSSEKFGFWDLTYNATEAVALFGWNDYLNLRSYWAVDPHYAENTNKDNARYPEQYREAKDVNGGVEYYSDKDATQVNALEYINYTQINQNVGEGNYQYAPENTFGYYNFMEKTGEEYDKNKETFEFKGNSYKRTSTHILISAQLLLDDEVESGDIADKYCYEGVYWTAEAADGNITDNNDKGECKELVKYMVNSLMNYFGTTIYTDDKGLNPINVDELATHFTLVDATIKGGDGRKMLSFSANGLHLFKYNGTNDNNEQTYLEIAKDDLEKAIYEVGTVQHFSEGKMYYAIPIEHMVKTQDVTEEDVTTHKWNVGSYGVVRNHWYKVNVSAISKPGTPVDDPEQEIIPNDEPDEGVYIAFNIVIIPWHVLNQDVTF